MVLISNWGSCDFKELKELQKRLQNQAEHQKLIEQCAKSLAARLLRMVRERTPVGQHKNHVGGTLRRGFTIGEIQKQGDTYQIEVINSVEYASFVEYGHRTRNHKGWVPGKFMLTISEKNIKEKSPAILESMIKKYLQEVVYGK